MKRVVLVVVCSLCMCVLLVALGQWPKIIGEYQARRIRSDPDLVREATIAPRHSAIRRGLEKLLREDAKYRTVILDRFIVIFSEWMQDFRRDLDAGSDVDLWIKDNEAGYQLNGIFGRVSKRSPRTLIARRSEYMRGKYSELLCNLKGYPIASRQLPGWVFAVSGNDDEYEAQIRGSRDVSH